MFNWFPTFRKAGAFFRNNVTRPGRALLFMAFFCSLGLVYLESPLLYLFTSIFSILILCGAASFAFRPNLSLRTVAPDLVQAGKQVKAELFLTNQRQRSAFEVFVESRGNQEDFELDKGEDSRLLHVIRPGKTARETLQFRFLKRGIYRLPKLVIGSTFPFNLLRFHQSRTSNHKVIVTPAFQPLQRFQLPGSRYINEFENERKLNFARAAGASEYIGNREYQQGMPVRRWDYSSWARTGKPIVREYREQQRGSAMIFVDSFFDKASTQNQERFESLLSLATAIVDALSKTNIVVSKLIIGPTVYSLIGSNLEEQLRTIGRHLAIAEISAEAEADLLSDNLFCEQAIDPDSYGFLLFNRLDSNRHYFYQQYEQGGNACLTRFVTHSDPNRQDIPGEMIVTPEAIRLGEVAL